MVWRAVHEATITGAVSFLANGFAYSSVTGTEPVWGDDSDATYATFAGRWGELVADDQAQGRAQLSPPPDMAVTGTYRVAMVWKEIGTVYAADDLLVAMSRDPGATYTARGTAGNTDLTAPAGWRIAELSPSTADGFTTWQQVMESWAGTRAYAELTTNFLTRAQPAATTYEEHSVSEVRLLVFFDVRVAPPCRLFPREDGLGVGGGRHFPPPKSQQRSGRGFGYY